MSSSTHEWTEGFDKHAAPEAVAASIRYWKKQRSTADQQLDMLLRLHGRRQTERDAGLWPGAEPDGEA